MDHARSTFSVSEDGAAAMASVRRRRRRVPRRRPPGLGLAVFVWFLGAVGLAYASSAQTDPRLQAYFSAGLVLLNPRAPQFNVTPKGETLSQDFISPLANPFYFLATLGLQTYRQDATPIFPLENSTATYAPTNTNTFIGSIRLDGLVLLTSQLAAGLTIKADKTANYNEYSVGVFLRYFFEPRGGLFATDF